MNPQDWLFAFLPEADVAVLCGVDPLRLGATASPASADWLAAVLESIAGGRTYDQRIRTLLDADERIHALEMAASAHAHGAILREETTSAVDLAWARVRDEASSRRAAVGATLAARDFSRSELVELVEIVRTELDEARVPDERPSHPHALAQALQVVERVKRLAAEAETLAVDLEKEGDDRIQRLRAATVDAVKVLVDCLFDTDSTKRSRAAEVMRALPVLVLDRRVDDVRAVANGDLDLVTFPTEGRVNARKTPLVPPPPVVKTSTDAVALSPVSQKLVQQAQGTLGPVVSAQDLRKLRQEAAKQPLVRRSPALLAASRGASTLSFANVLLGEGLLAAAERYLFEEGNARMAHFCASDAVAAISCSEEHYEQPIAEEAVGVLLLCRFWPLMQAQARKGGEFEPYALRRDISKLMSWIEEQGELEAVGQVWARERPEVARELLNVVSPLATTAGALYRACAFALIRQELFLDFPERAVDKLIVLLEPALPSTILREAMQRVAREIAAADRGRIASASRNVILRELQVIESELAKLTASVSVPRDAIADLLPTVIRALVEAPTLDASPQLSMPRTIESVFVADRADEIRLPVVIENAEKAGTARDLHVQVAIEADDPAAVSLLEPREQPLAQLDPGEHDERSFYCNIARTASAISRLELRVTVRAGAEVVERSMIPIVIRRESRKERKSPYQPGIALEADEGFVGRERQQKTITDALLSDAVRVPLVVGIRRVGKTSLLHAIRREPRVVARYVTKYVSFESRPESDTSVQLLLYVAEALRELLVASIGEREANAIYFARDEFRTDPYAAFEHFTAAIEHVAPKRGLLLVLDEFDKLLSIVDKGKARQQERAAPLRPDEVLQPEIFGALRSMIMRGRAIRVVIAGLPRLLRIGYEERFFGMLEPVRIAGFTEDEARAVISFARTTMKLTAAAEHHVLRASGGQPYLLQVICHGLFTHMLEEGRDVVTGQDVDEVLERYVLQHQTYFTDFVDLLDNRNLHLVKTIARLQRDAPSRRYVSVAEVEAALLPDGPTGAELRTRLEELMTEDRPLLERRSGRLRLTIGILADHLLR